MSLLEINDLNKRFGGLHAVNSVSFAVNQGDIKAVIGPNGAGKTTLFNLICGALPADSGSVLFNGGQILGYRPFQIAATGISRTFQNIKMFPGMTALENVMVGLHTKSRSGFWSGMLHLPFTRHEEKKVRQGALELLELLDISAYADVEAASLALASSGPWNLPGPWPPTPPCCSWTNRQPVSTSMKPLKLPA